jgi:hypothetical protein
MVSVPFAARLIIAEVVRAPSESKSWAESHVLKTAFGPASGPIPYVGRRSIFDRAACM